jgi:L-asparaginase/Glu-tRNA(Gln) amidotransferase subunit D
VIKILLESIDLFDKMGGSAFIDGKPTQSHYPESRVLIIMTGGTICMQPSADGLVPMTGFLENAMAPRPSFNDNSVPAGEFTSPSGESAHTR